jgi:hypothetical protein
MLNSNNDRVQEKALNPTFRYTLRQDTEISEAFGSSNSKALWPMQSGELQHLFTRLP